MNKQLNNIDNFKNQIDQKNIIHKLVAKNLKGGIGEPPPFGMDPS